MNERKFLIRNVKKARDLINGKLKITPKDKTGDLVTNFDLEIEKFLIKKIKRTYPDFEIVSEEFNGEKELSKNCFVIDPIDGTNNFARKIPLWGMQIACIKNNEVVASVIYLPIYEELYSADKSGAYLNDEKIHVNQQNEKIGVYSMEQAIPQSYEIQKKNRNCRLFGSSAFTLSMVACGKTSAAMFKDTIHPWDIIPGEYLVKQAGGISFVNNHIKVCANSPCWSNLLTTTKEIEANTSNIIEVEPELESKPELKLELEIDEPEDSKETLIKPEPDFIEESEAIIETFVATEEDENLETPIIVEETKVEEKVVKPAPKPVQSIIKKPSLTEARRRKIIM